MFMAFVHDIQNEKAMISIDFLTGIGVLLIAFLFASYTIHSVMTPYTGYSKELYPVADRAATLLVKDEGYWTDGNDFGTEWNTVWDENQTYVRKIGLIKSDGNHTIDSRKLNVFMEKHDSDVSSDVFWWEYPTSSTDSAELENVSRALGLEGYYFYIQIRPVNESLINVSEANTAAIDAVGEQSDVVAVTRLATTEHTTFGQFNGADLFGHASPTKILFVIEPEDFDLITNGITFTISNWLFEDTNESDFQWIRIGNVIDADYDLKDKDKLKDEDYTVFRNGVDVSDSVPFQFNKTDTIKFIIPVSTLDDSLPDRYTSGNAIYLQLNVDSKVEIKDDGQTQFSSTKKSIKYPMKITLWTW